MKHLHSYVDKSLNWLYSDFGYNITMLFVHFIFYFLIKNKKFEIDNAITDS